MTARTVLQQADIARALTRISHEILESNRGTNDLVLLGIPTRGVVLARRNAEDIQRIEPDSVRSPDTRLAPAAVTASISANFAGYSTAEAERLDPRCAMCLWGQALVLGPNINLPMDPLLAAQATDLATRAVGLSANARPADRALIEALGLRYANPAPEDRKAGLAMEPKSGAAGRARAVADYIAGMTDRYAFQEHSRLLA